MKPSLVAGAAALFFVPSSGFSSNTRVSSVQPAQSLLARVTVYWANGGRGSDGDTRQHRCSTGVRLRAGHCAVDPHRIPYGSKVVFSDAVLTAVDTGTAVITRKAARASGRTSAQRNAIVIDRFFETKREAVSWERAHPAFMTVQVITPNSRRAMTTTQVVATTPPARQFAARSTQNRAGFVLR
ncbi:MAG: hypothetical protein ACJ8JD_05540 [Chthoniobacterales bacterium]